MPNFLFRCAKVVRRTVALRSAPTRPGSGTSVSRPTDRTSSAKSRVQRAGRLKSAAAVVLLALSLTACGGNAAGNGDDGRPVVLTTFTVLADVAKNVAGDKLRVESITKAGAEIHGYEPTPGDIRKASQAGGRKFGGLLWRTETES